MKQGISGVPPLVLDGVAIRIVDGVVRFSGVLAMRDPSETVTPFLRRIHSVVIESGARRVKVDLTELRFMNSSSIRSLVDWVEWVRQESAERQYVIHFKTNPEVTWQSTTLEALQCLGGKHVAVEGGTSGYVDQTG